MLAREFFADDSDLRGSARMSEDEISEVARVNSEIEDWSFVDMRPPQLRSEDGKLVWQVRFAPVDENRLPMKGGDLTLTIDDQTGQVIRKNKIPK